ncbi:hypothetical protein FB562_2196 [Homoserinimonas aerilata]|uniref:Uncharacterized protein n=1 Tax=Homoserinimonas aerilata TaxID=1162970 RepID=A0A542YF24_9MICO|nr:hypothetical protein [Homoserinimonas aerilata]TQL46672.1 hypothetical protein FB562_2196 [Homoserinimonas aerilata]
MADPLSPELLFRRGLAQFLHDKGHGVYKPVGSYTATERGIYTSGPTLPAADNCIVLTSLPSIADGRADLTHRVQVFGRVKGNNIAAENLEQAIFADLDHTENTPPSFYISWTHRFSLLHFEADSNGCSAFAATYYFRGRR